MLAMNLKICIAEDNYFLTKAIKEKLSFFDDISVKFHANNGAELIGVIGAPPSVTSKMN